MSMLVVECQNSTQESMRASQPIRECEWAQEILNAGFEASPLKHDIISGSQAQLSCQLATSSLINSCECILSSTYLPKHLCLHVQKWIVAALRVPVKMCPFFTLCSASYHFSVSLPLHRALMAEYPFFLGNWGSALDYRTILMIV